MARGSVARDLDYGRGHREKQRPATFCVIAATVPAATDEKIVFERRRVHRRCLSGSLLLSHRRPVFVQPDRHLRRNAAMAVQQIRQRLAGDAERVRRGGHG